MIIVSDEQILHNQQLFLQRLKEGSGAILESSYLSKTFPKYEREYNRTYPYVVKIPKSIKELAQGDFEPAYEIIVKEPFKGSFCNIWFGDSAKGVNLHCGYVDGNSSQPSKYVLGDNNVHMILAGATGQGKSVALNSIIFGFCLEYAPWEVDLTLCDAKIVEFKSYAKQTPMPHIRRIAATNDTDYILSVLELLKDEMTLLNSAFTKAGVKKIEDFREATGLCLPQHIIVVDEYQALVQSSKKDASKLADLIDAFARLGRNTGYHIILASQEISSDIDKGTLANIKLRACLGCSGDVSDKVLGNSAAKMNYGQKGRLIINDNPVESNNEQYNCNIVVPFMPDSERVSLGEEIIRKAKDISYESVLSFFDAEAPLMEEEYQSYLNSFEKKNRIILGPPSYVTNEAEQILALDLTGKDIENLLVLTSGNNNNIRYFKTLMGNVKRFPDVQNLIICLDDIFVEKGNANQYAAGKLFNTDNNFASNTTLSIASTTLFRRWISVEIDEAVFGNQIMNNNNYDEYFYEIIPKGSEEDTEINRQRFSAGMYLVSTNVNLQRLISVDTVNQSDKKVDFNKRCAIELARVIHAYRIYHSESTQITIDNFPPIFVWILGLDKMQGIGRDTKNAYINKLKTLLLDCSRYNIRFILFSNKLEDIQDITNGIRWCIIDDVAERERNRIKGIPTDDYPRNVGPLLAMLTDQLSSKNKIRKFKKMQLAGEFLL